MTTPSEHLEELLRNLPPLPDQPQEIDWTKDTPYQALRKINAMLEQMGYEVRVVKRGEEA